MNDKPALPISYHDLVKPGNDSSELKLARMMMVAGVILAVASALGRVPFTPDQMSAYLANLIKEATAWSKALLPYVTAIWGFYTASRHKQKTKAIESITKIALKGTTAA